MILESYYGAGVSYVKRAIYGISINSFTVKPTIVLYQTRAETV
jgi:hypothetical protein